jgi:hypothetical protein
MVRINGALGGVGRISQLAQIATRFCKQSWSWLKRDYNRPRDWSNQKPFGVDLVLNQNILKSTPHEYFTAAIELVLDLPKEQHAAVLAWTARLTPFL